MPKIEPGNKAWQEIEYIQALIELERDWGVEEC